jgi:hypothetical protein
MKLTTYLPLVPRSRICGSIHPFNHLPSWRSESESESESESYVTTDGQPASLSWNKAPIWGLRPDLFFFYLCDSYGLVLVGRPL